MCICEGRSDGQVTAGLIRMSVGLLALVEMASAQVARYKGAIAKLARPKAERREPCD
jgi:hypothetical protein